MADVKPATDERVARILRDVGDGGVGIYLWKTRSGQVISEVDVRALIARIDVEQARADAALGPWPDDVPLRGEGAPENDGHIEHLIRYLQSVRKRFGNTVVTVRLSWGSNALWKMDEQEQRIAELEAQVERLKKENSDG